MVFRKCWYGCSKIYRALWQLKYNGWFNKCNGVLIGRAGLYENLGTLH